jgi:hypothetical protein
MSKVQTIGIDAHEMMEDLWQGSLPVEGSYLASLGFKVLVLCAEEHQPPADRFPGLQVIHAPFDDADYRAITPYELGVVKGAVDGVVASMHQGLPVLVTCYAGRNRSGLVTALAIHQLSGRSGVDIVKTIKRKRPLALTNLGFRDYVEKLAKITGTRPRR